MHIAPGRLHPTRTKAGRCGPGQKMVVGRAIESYGDDAEQVKGVGGIDSPEMDCRTINCRVFHSSPREKIVFV